MNFDDLKQVIKHLKNSVSCTNCSKKFLYKNISVLLTMLTEGLFSMKCGKCGYMTIVEVGLTPHRSHRTIVTNKDVNEMHEFLDNFNGDFKQLFKSLNK